MSDLPNESSASASKGLWFVFNDGKNIIRAWGSYWTGLERIYFNEQLVLESAARDPYYEFEIDGVLYRIEFCSQSVAIGQLRCSFYKNGVLLYALRSKRRKVINIRPIVAHISACIIFGTIAGLLHFPLWSSLCFIMLSIGITLLSNAKRDKFVIEEIRHS